jgi:hypothetical protein
MSTELQTLSGGQLSQEILDKLQQHTTDERQRIGSSAGGDVITVDNGKKVFVTPKEQELSEIECHIVDFAYRNEYYIGAYNPKVITPPACFAIAASSVQLAPSDNSPVKQNQTDCATCQQNQFGTSPTGAGKACKNTVLLALLPVDDVAGHDIWIVKTSPTAIRPFNKYASKISQMNIPIGVVRTKLYFDPDASYASIRFDALGIEADNVDAVMARKDEATKRLMQEPDVSQFEMPNSGGKRGK